MITIVDFGSQTTHLIGRRLRDLGIKVQILETNRAYQTVKRLKPAGIILSGGPASVFDSKAPTINPKIFDLKIPILGICYGWQLTAQLLKGRVKSKNKEYGPTKVEIKRASPLFANVKAKRLNVWMSHGDEVIKLPVGFDYHVSTSKVKAAGVGNFERKIFGVQFHPEVEHTQEGKRILQNFAERICGLKTIKRRLDVTEVINQVRQKVNKVDKNARVIAAISGGMDSTVAASIVAAAIGRRFVPVYCDNGLMRLGTRAEVEQIFGKHLDVQPKIIRCKTQFLKVLKKVTDPEKKRLIIGNLYIKLFEKAAKEESNIRFLMQGTIYSDVIESQGSRHASKIKSHHNVGGLPKKLGLKLLEPVRNFYKDEVRQLGRQLGLPEVVLNKQPFPGPGQAIRILGEVTASRLQKQQQADQIVIEVLKKTGWYEKVFQSFPVLTGAYSTAVKGDGREFAEVVALRVYDSSDIMTAGWTHLPYEVLQMISTRIVNEVPNVSRVVYDITTKPPATMEWE